MCFPSMLSHTHPPLRDSTGEKEANESNARGPSASQPGENWLLSESPSTVSIMEQMAVTSCWTGKMLWKKGMGGMEYHLCRMRKREPLGMYCVTIA